MPRAARRGPSAAAVSVVAAATALLAGLALGEVDRDLYHDPDRRVELLVPEGWFLSEQASYPGLLVTAVRRDAPGRMTLASSPVTYGSAAHESCERSKKTLERAGFAMRPPGRHATGACLLDGDTPRRRASIRQAHRVHEDRVYVLTLAAPPVLLPGYVQAFDDTLTSMVFLARPPPTPDAALEQTSAADAGAGKETP